MTAMLQRTNDDVYARVERNNPEEPANGRASPSAAPERVCAAINRLLTSQPTEAHEAGAREAFRYLQIPEPWDNVAVGSLAREVWAQFQRMESYAWDAPFAAQSVRGMLPADARAADFLETVGPRGKALAAGVRENSRKRWKANNGQHEIEDLELWGAWYRPGFASAEVPLLGALSIATQADIVGPKLVALQHPAIASGALDAWMATMWTHGSSLDDQRMFRWLIHETFSLHIGTCARRVVELQGGLSLLAERFGVASSGPTTKRLGRTLARLCATPTGMKYAGKEPWLKCADIPEAPARARVLRVIPNDALWPNFVSTLPKRTATQRAARELIPMPAALPPLSGAARHHGAIACLQLLVLQEVRTQAALLSRGGFVHIGTDDWNRLAARARLPEVCMAEVIDTWLTGTDTAPAFMRRVGRHSYDLASAHAPMRAFIMEGARLQAEGVAAQKAATRRTGRHKNPVQAT